MTGVIPIIDTEFRALIPPLSDDELVLLEANITAMNGATDPLKVWADRLLDGHNRLDICQRLALPFDTIEIKLDSREHALLWIEENQLGRRNLSDDQRAAIARRVQKRRSKLLATEHAKAAAEQRWSGVCPSDDVSDEHNNAPAFQKRDTRAEVAREMKVPERKLRAITEIEKNDPAAVDRIARGETTIVAERAKQNAEARAAIASLKPTVPTGRYSCIVIDPPWPMEKIEREVRPNQVGFEYPTMSEEDLAEFPIADIAEADCHLFTWTTHRFLPMALRLLEEWGFRYVCTFVWHKPGGFQPIGLPQYNCEFALYARRGAPKFVDLKQFFCCFNGDRREHSRKPEEFYNLIARVTSEPRIDVFSREPRAGFAQHGNETGKFTA